MTDWSNVLKCLISWDWGFYEYPPNYIILGDGKMALGFWKILYGKLTRIIFKLCMLLQGNPSMKNTIKQQESTASLDVDSSNVTRLSILLKGTLKHMQHPEYRVFKSLPFADICTALLLRISTEMNITNSLELIPSSS